MSTTFADNRHLPVHRWFRFPAGYSGSWVTTFLSEHGGPGGHILDPFAGSGTTPLAAQQAGWESVGIEAHPFLARVARAKLGWDRSPDELLDRAGEVVRSARPFSGPASPLLDRCFSAGSLAELSGLSAAIQEHGADEQLWLALMAILRKCSRAGTAPWQYVLPARKKERVAEPQAAFLRQVSLMADDIATLQARVASPPRAQVVDGDARTCAAVPEDWADVIVTSPPYANNFDYADATRLEMTFLGLAAGWGDLSELRRALTRSCSQQVGGLTPEELLDDPALAPVRAELIPVYEALDAARRDRAGRKAYHLMVAAYFADMAATWHALRRASRNGALVCMVVGDSAPYGVHLPVERWLGELALSAGFHRWTFEKVRDRNVKWQNRKHRVPLHEGRLLVS